MYSSNEKRVMIELQVNIHYTPRINSIAQGKYISKFSKTVGGKMKMVVRQIFLYLIIILIWKINLVLFFRKQNFDYFRNLELKLFPLIAVSIVIMLMWYNKF